MTPCTSGSICGVLTSEREWINVAVNSGFILNRASVFSSDYSWINKHDAIWLLILSLKTCLTGVKVTYSSNKKKQAFLQLSYFKLAVHPFHPLSNCSNMPFFKFLHEKFLSARERPLSDSPNQKQRSSGSFPGCSSSLSVGFFKLYNVLSGGQELGWTRWKYMW